MTAEYDVCLVCESKMVSGSAKWRCLGCGATGKTDRAGERIVLAAPAFFDYFNTAGRRQEVLAMLREGRAEAIRQMEGT